MKHQLYAGSVRTGFARIPLQQLIDGLVGNSLPVAVQRHSVVVNEVGRGVFLRNLDEKLVTLLDEVLAAVIANSQKGDIRIRAEVMKNQLVLSITDRNNYNGFALSWSIGALAAEANRIGGSLDINDPRRLETTVLFSFPGGVAA